MISDREDGHYEIISDSSLGFFQRVGRIPLPKNEKQPLSLLISEWSLIKQKPLDLGYKDHI